MATTVVAPTSTARGRIILDGPIEHHGHPPLHGLVSEEEGVGQIEEGVVDEEGLAARVVPAGDGEVAEAGELELVGADAGWDGGLAAADGGVAGEMGEAVEDATVGDAPSLELAAELGLYGGLRVAADGGELALRLPEKVKGMRCPPFP